MMMMIMNSAIMMVWGLSQIGISLDETGILAFWNGETCVAEDKFLRV
jgi:hypothetical protein